jgi:hypothetical protein
MFTRMFLVYCAGFFCMSASCNKHPTSVEPVTPVSQYAGFWGLWQAAYQSGPESGKFKLLLNRDTTFSFSQVPDSSGAAFNQDTGAYRLDTTLKILWLTTPVHEGKYKYAGDTLVVQVTWDSGHDYMFAQNPALATWEFFKQ